MVKRRSLALLVLFAVLLAAGWFLLEKISDSGIQAGNDLVRNAIRNAVITCYAVEGAYPDTLEYLRENYGLAYDENQYIVRYDAFASNLFPDIQVLKKGGASS